MTDKNWIVKERMSLLTKYANPGEETRIAASYNRITAVICPVLEYIYFTPSLSFFAEEGTGTDFVLILKHL